jgi:hypothetical protein
MLWLIRAGVSMLACFTFFSALCSNMLHSDTCADSMPQTCLCDADVH